VAFALAGTILAAWWLTWPSWICRRRCWGLSPTLREATLSDPLAVRVDRLRIDCGRAAGKLQAYWKGAGSSLSRIRPRGNCLLVMNGKGDAMDFNLTTMGGPLTLDGSGN
jgi:hypothetical protein